MFASEHHGLPHVGNARTLHDESREPIDHRVEHHTRPVVAVVTAAKGRWATPLRRMSEASVAFLPIAFDETNNPNFTGCLNRNP